MINTHTVATPGAAAPSCPFEAYSPLLCSLVSRSRARALDSLSPMTSRLVDLANSCACWGSGGFALTPLNALALTPSCSEFTTLVKYDMHAPSSRAVSLWLVNGYWARFARPWRGLRPRPAGRVHVLSTCESECVGVGCVCRTPNILFENIWVHGKFLGFSGGVCL